MFIIFYFFVSVIFNYSHCKDVESLANDDESRLSDYLFKYKGYNHLIRPVVNLTDVVTVKLELALIQLINVEEKKQILKSNVWIRMQWVDYQLTWEPADFGGIKVTRVSAKRVWKPDIVLFNNADGNYEVLWQPNILIDNKGGILWIPPAIYVSSCDIIVDYFPFDEQNCEIRFGSWTFNSKQISLQLLSDKIDLSTYWKSGTWDIVSCPGTLVNGTTDSSGVETPMIKYRLTIRRKTLFYTVILILPCLLISILTVTVFYLPADDHHKMTLCISILLALIVFFLLISKLLPPTSTSIPLISKYLLFTFIVNIVVIVFTVVIINLNYRTPRTHYMSPWIKKLFINYLPVLLGMNRPKHIELEMMEYRKIVPSPAVNRRVNKRQPESNASVVRTFQNLRPNSKKILRLVDSQISMGLINKGIASNSETMGGRDYDGELGIQRLESREELWDLDNRSMMPSTSYNHMLQNSFSFRHNMSDNDSSMDYVSTESEHCIVDEQQISLTDEMNIVGAHEGELTEDVEDDDDDDDNDDNSFNGFFRGIEITEGIREAMLSISFISSHTDSQDEFTKGKLEWQFVASVIDRLMLLIFSTVTIIGSAVLFLRTPYFFSLVDPNHELNEC